MKRLFLIIGILVIGCSDFNPMTSDDCGCGLEIYSDELDIDSTDGIYELEFDTNYGEGVQTFATLNASTDCGWSQHLLWDTNYQYRIGIDWVSLVNPASMTDEDGNGQVVFGVWEDFVNDVVTVYCGYRDECGVHHLDSLKIKVIDNE
jgi:hypothetical protein